MSPCCGCIAGINHTISGFHNGTEKTLAQINLQKEPKKNLQSMFKLSYSIMEDCQHEAELRQNSPVKHLIWTDTSGLTKVSFLRKSVTNYITCKLSYKNTTDTSVYSGAAFSITALPLKHWNVLSNLPLDPSSMETSTVDPSVYFDESCLHASHWQDIKPDRYMKRTHTGQREPNISC